jgi:uncharacterized protein YkwD
MPPCPRPTLAVWAGVAALSVGLAGCGGGGSAEAPAAAAPLAPPVSSPAPPPATSPAPAPGTRLTCNIANFQAEMLAAVNAHRRAGATCGARGAFPPATELVWNAALTQSSAAHSEDMVARNFFSHTGSSGSTIGTRATAAGYVWRTVGENIAAGQPSIAVVVDGWMKSDGHCANLMNPNFRDIGAACVAGNAGTTYRTYWTQNFGAQR